MLSFVSVFGPAMIAVSLGCAQTAAQDKKPRPPLKMVTKLSASMRSWIRCRKFVISKDGNCYGHGHRTRIGQKGTLYRSCPDCGGSGWVPNESLLRRLYKFYLDKPSSRPGLQGKKLSVVEIKKKLRLPPYIRALRPRYGKARRDAQRDRFIPNIGLITTKERCFAKRRSYSEVRPGLWVATVEFANCEPSETKWVFLDGSWKIVSEADLRPIVVPCPEPKRPRVSNEDMRAVLRFASEVIMKAILRRWIRL